MNEVIHSLERNLTETIDDESGEDESSKLAIEGDTSDESESEENPTPDEMEVDESFHSASENDLDGGSLRLSDSLQRNSAEKEGDLGLIGFKDDIPDEEFEKMIAGELDPWGSHDDGHDKHRKMSDKDEVWSHDSKSQSCDTVEDQRCMSHDIEVGSKLIALILAPTRELAIQVHDHLTAVAKYTKVKV